MKCTSLVDGEQCGAEIPPSTKFCGFCGGQVVTEQDEGTKTCPKCSTIVTKKQKFCTGCGWKVDPTIFTVEKIICIGKREDGTPCGTELSPGVRFCPECGTDQSPVNVGPSGDKGPETAVNIEEFVQDETLRQPAHVSELSDSSSSRSDSPDTWKPPGSQVSTPESENTNRDEKEKTELQNSELRINILQTSTSKSGDVEMRKDEKKGTVLQSSEMSDTDGTQLRASSSVSGDVENRKSEQADANTQNSEILNTENRDDKEMDSQNDTDVDSTAGNSTDLQMPDLQSKDTSGKALLQKDVSEVKQITTTNIEGMDVDEENADLLKSSEAEILPPCDQIVNNDGNSNTEQEKMEIEHSNVSQTTKTPEISIISQSPLGLPTLSDSDKSVKSPEPSDTANSGVTKQQRESTGSFNEEQAIPLHHMVTRSSKGKVQQLSQSFENSLQLKSPAKGGKTDSKASSSEPNNDDVENANIPDEKENTDDKDVDHNDDEGSQDDSLSSAESGEESKDNQSNKKRKKRKKNKKVEEQKKKDRKKRKQNRDKGDDEGMSSIPEKPERGKKNKAEGGSEKRAVAKKEQNLSAEQDKTSDKDEKNLSNNATAADSTKKSETVPTNPQSSGPSYASVASSTVNTSQGTNQRNKAFIDIHFHCIVASKMVTNFEKDKLYVVFGDTSLGGWLARRYQMKGVRTLNDDSVEYEGIFSIPRGIAFRRLNYNYLMLQDKHEVWEYVYYSGGLSGNSLWRTLNIYGSDVKKGIYHRYDGVVRDNPTVKKTWIENLKKHIKEFVGIDDYKKVLYADAEHAAKSFMPHWQITSFDVKGINGEEVINHVKFVADGLREVYCRVAGLWQGSDFDTLVRDILKPSLQALLPVLYKKDDLSEERKTLRLVTAITIAYLTTEYEIHLDDCWRNVLCDVLLPFQGFEKSKVYNMETVLSFFPQSKQKVTDGLLKFSRHIMSKTSNPRWMFCVPVIHFLQGKCIPHAEASFKVNHSDTKPEWWGIVEFKGDIDYFTSKTVPWESSPEHILNCLMPYFKMDHILPRSFMAALKLEQIPSIVESGHIPIDVILAVVFYYARTYLENRDVSLRKLFNQVIKQTLSAEPTEISFCDAWRSMRISADMIEDNLKSRYLQRENRIAMMEVFMIMLHIYDKVQEDVDFKSKVVKEAKITKDTHLKLFNTLRTDFCDWLSKETFYAEEENYIARWNTALKMKIPNGHIRETYLKYAEDCLKKEMLQWGSHEKLIQIYLIQNEMYENAIQAVLSEVALKAINNCKNLDMEIMREHRVVLRFSDLINNVLERNWDQSQQKDPHQTLKHAITWAPFPAFIEMFYKFSKHLKEDCLMLLRNSVEILKCVVQQLFNGEIMIQYLQTILEKRDSFQKVVEAIEDVNTKSTMITLNIRQKELQAYKDTLTIVQEFTYFSIYCKADTLKMDEKIQNLKQLGSFRLSEIVKIIPIEEIADPETYKPYVIVFELTREQLEILPDIIECKEGLLFTKLWEERGNELKKEKSRKLTIDEVLDEVWEPVCCQWKTLCEKLRKGDLLFSEFERFFGKTEVGNLKAELLLLQREGNTTWVDSRLDQIEKYRNLRSCEFGAEAILEVVDAFELEGDFNQIREIIKYTKGADTSMNKLDRSLLKTCDILREVTKDRAECLKTFIRCKQLVDWLRESMPSGLKELKVFVDLASISAGEGDMEIDKVNCLHSATTGYAPLIFNLEKTCGTKKFLEKCQEVWRELLANPQLPNKLVDTNRQLAWLQTVKKSHGSVEVSSLQQAEAINTKGIYQVGNLTKSGNVRKTTLSEVLELRVAEEEGNIAQRNHYKYDQLHDLQSRLMLVAGKAEKGKDEVDRFMLILDSVVRLGNIYTKLVEEGCVLFSQWHVKFLCDKGRKACAFINFGYGEDRHTMKGRIDEANEDVSSIIPKIAKFLEQCHEKWLSYINEKRDKYYLLNFFTIDQMVILQQELVKIGSNQEPSALIYPLLSVVKQGCTKEDLVAAMLLAKADVEKLDFERQTEMETKDSEEEEMAIEQPDELKVEKFIGEMTNAGYPVELAKEALKNVDPTDIDGGIVWCMDNEDTFVSIEDHLGTQPMQAEQAGFSGWTKSCQSLASVTGSLVDQLGVGTGENAVEKLIKALEDLWETFLTSISSSVSDYLSIEHLGMILNRLADEETFTVERTFLPCFIAGEPNLIICPQSEIYNGVLSVYSHEDDKPLPQSDEVLLCTPNTTLDTLEIFWRRALFADNNKVHCLVNADLLDYDVSDRGEKSLERHMKNADSRGKKYKLVVICSSENEYKSRIVAALDKYHRPQLPTDVATIRKYLLTKLKVDKTQTGIRPASAVDFERCSVRVVKSWRAGIGKTLYKKRMVANLYNLVHNIPRRKASNVTIPLHEKAINIDDIMDILLEETLPPRCHEPRIFHIDISHEVQEGVDALLFQLLILGCLGHRSGNVWRKSEDDYYIIESMPLLARDTDSQGTKLKCLHHCLDILPHVICRSPQESLDILSDVRRPPDYTDHDRLFDSIEFKSTTFQRPYQYLKRLDTNCRLDDVKPNIPDGDKKLCLTTLLRHCGIRDPSWSELHHFVSFLNKQLQDFEVSAFCGLAAVEDLPGFAKFVLRFLIQMSRDFSTRSLVVSEESPIQMLQRQISDEDEQKEGDKVIQLYQMRRTWETSPHPYLFFNPDHHSMTFLGFNVERRTGNLIDLQTRRILDQGIMQQNLFDALVRNHVNLAENFDNLPRHEKIMKLCNVMGLDMAHDPDETYELTTDNVKKILAIYMRFRCDIPVIIMGETGCGKTRLIKFMCSLQQPPGVTVENMILMKVHGGTKASDIVRKVKKAEKIADENARNYPNMDTVLFFDEANTTEAIGVIKEIMCDKSLGGKPIQLHEKLKIVAACNPYRKHSEELIKRLEQAGLGYHVDADKTSDKLGRVPMRRLVYRVQPLPQSMLPLVWDFGQLDTEVEELYIRQMVLRYIKNQQLPPIGGLETTVSRILTVSQDFMRKQKDECSFVSLRDVERVLQVMSWFYKQSQSDDDLLFHKIREDSEYSDTESEDEEMEMSRPHEETDDVTRSLVLALGVCYHACLKNRDEYRDTVARYFTQPLQLPGGADQIEEEISRCQSVFLDSVDLAPNIAKNQALRENVFMMIVCTELRIPMFLVGKPGSSKSLAKTIVADAMQGNAAHNDLFKTYKQVQMVSFQCSPLSVPEGIVGTFRTCASYQKDKNLDNFVSVVVLDEIGLAEDSPRMPLKTLHPLLEDGCPDDEEPEKFKKVAFIGISNWALDPAKMNRGILVQREVPDVKELKESAEGICSTSNRVLKLIKPMIPLMADSYLDLFKEASTEMREFFGLRDFYSLLKMLYAFVSATKKKPTWLQLKHSILRNFGGLEKIKPVDIFYSKLSHLVDKHEQQKENDPDCTPAGMIQACLTGESKTKNSESRYLLLLTENYGALSILQQKIITMENVQVIFGSSFPSDQEYTQVCRNINRIKVCMETGSTVILLNLENLYESLYDALNQYYVYFGGERYVDLGLGTHRVKCRVHKKFRLIVVAEKQIVYNKFPIPLINRLEKHFLSLKTMLSPAQLELADKLQDWAQHFCEVKVPVHMRHLRNLKQLKDIKKIGDAFMGYHADTCAAIILHVCQEKRCNDEAIPQIEKEILTDAEDILLWCATPAAVLQLEKERIFNTYFLEQHHESLGDYLSYKINDQQQHNIHAQITTNSKLLSTADLDILCRFIPIQRPDVTLLTLQSFDTEQQFSRQIKSFFESKKSSDMLLIVQCDCGDQNADLIACARYTVQGELQQVQIERTTDIHVIFLVQLPGIAGGCFNGFQCGLWHSVHIDDIHPAPEDIPSVADMHGKSVSALLSYARDKTDINMDIEENQEVELMETNEGEVDLMDIEIEEKSAVQMHRSKRQFKIDYLIKKCLQPALGNVKDPATDSSRAIDRLKILLHCLQNEEGELTVLSGIAKHLSSILKEKEQTIGSMITNWLSKEASKPENMNRAGTFRKFAVQCLESKVTPVLAGIIAFIDTNRNLDILLNKGPQDWQFDLWIQIFNNPELTQLKYSLMVSPSRQQELQEVSVKMTSKEGKAMAAVMPFSWILFGQIDEVLRETMNSKEMGDTHFDVVMKASEIFHSLPMGRLLASIEGTHIHDIIKLYVVDFVQMVHPVQSIDESNLVCESVFKGCRILIRGEFGRLIPSLIGCHMTYNLYDTRFKNYSYIVHAWPVCSQRICQFQEKDSNFYLITDEEMTLDILALHLLVENLEPNKEALNRPDSRTKWLRQVCDYRPVVERIFGHFNQDIENKENQYGQRCQRGIERARCQWTRAVVVKLFIEHVCTAGKEEIDIKRCMPLWVTLRDGADMKEVQSLEKVEKFLKVCNKDVVGQCFGQQAKCVSCENFIQGAPVRLPCDHVICRKCFFDCVTLKDFECPNCHEEFPQDFNPNQSKGSGEIRKYQDYRNRCNSFFMEVVSQLCFSEGTPPSQEVIDKLLSYIIGHVGVGKKVVRVVSKELTIFDDTIDPTPVVRSFLLQQLMQTSGHDIEQYLAAYFDNARQLITGDPQHLVDLCMLVLQCMEDSLHQQWANRDDEVTIATKMLRDAAPVISLQEINALEKIDHISRTRFSLAVVAKYIHKHFSAGQHLPDPTLRRLFDAAAKLCEECKMPWPRRFFVKQLCRCYGIDSYQTVLTKSDASFLRWVRLPELKADKVKECHDRYIVTGERYKDLRETVVTTVLGESSEKIEELLQRPGNEWQTRVRLLLALHREITMNNVYGGEPKKFTDKGKQFLDQLIMNHNLTNQKEVAQRILNNTLWRLDGNIVPRMDLAQQNIFCLLTHYFVLMVELPGKKTLITPLKKLALKPQSMTNSFFPTMPQDEMAEIKEAVLAARRLNPNENPVFYRCPNGHPYIIGNCGNPTSVGICKACGREIGGEGYKLREGNALDAGGDRTETGHVLGRADRLGPVTAPERKLNRATFSVLRLLTHLSMYIGANENPTAVCQSIKPNIEQGNLAVYLLQHIDLDMTSIQNVLGKNKDDVLVLIHCIMSHIMDAHNMAVIGEQHNKNICQLLDKDSRAKWEEDFSNKFIIPVLQDMDNIIQQCNHRILNDQRLGSDPLLQILYETDKPQDTQDVLILHEIPAVWRYRALISVNHLRQNLDTTKAKLPVLRLFLKEEHQLRAIRYIPSIIRLQKILIQKYSRKLDRAEATTLTIKDVKQQMRQERRLKEFGHLLDDYIEAWNCVKESLETYVCPANEILITVAKEYCRSNITDTTSISHLIPTHSDAGLCSYVLLFFLLKKQNLFLQNYCMQTKQKEESLPKVHVKDISAAHLISYHPDKDLLPMVLANCNYSFEVGQGTRVEYNFASLERQLMDRFLFSKSIIREIQEIEIITYRSESTNSIVFKSLCDKVKQERLNPAVSSQICGEIRLKSYPDLCDSLDKLDIAISFLKSVGSDPESSLYDFMVDTLKINNPFPSPKAQQASRCKHTMSLWITLAMERAKFLAKYDKKAFEGISDNFKKPITDKQRDSIEDMLKTLPVEQIDILVELIFECIVLKIDVPQNSDDEDFVDMSKISLRDALIGYLDASPYDEEMNIDDTLMMAIGRLPSDRDDTDRILTGQSIEVWILVNKVFTDRQRQRH